MQLKRLEAYGFKSFADKITIDFDSGITAIVGPNGSGKSNITDAIRWVLGEQNVRNLRGARAEDIIFTGSAGRKPLGLAEVSLFFANDGTLPVDFREVVVTRRLYRSGESEFYINRARCRLKDIYNLFADTGIGHDGMSIIGQNRIDDILNSKPEERRLFFEETAGITKYRSRKRETVRRLTDTENNLVRVQDIIREIENQLEPLARQAERTRIYNGLAEEQKKCRLTQLALDYQRESQRYGENEQKLQKKREEALTAEAEVNKAEARRQELGKKLIELEKTMQEQAGKSERLRQNIEAASREVAALEERQEQSEATKERILARRQELSSLQAQQVAELAGLAAEEKQKQADFQLAGELLQKERERAATYKGTIAARQQELNAAREGLNIAQRKLTSAQQECAMLERMQQAYEGFGKAPKAVLKAREPWRKGVAGAVAELMEVPAEYVTAIEVALGSAQQNLVTRDTDTAKAAIAFLKQQRLGRATFLPLSTIVQRTVPDLQVAGEQGVLDWASRLVKVPAEYGKVADFLLARTLVVDNLDHALALARKHNQKLRLVTLTGELINPGGSLSGGGRGHQEAGFLNRSAEIEALQGKISEGKAKVAGAEDKLASAQKMLEEARQDAEELASLIHEREIKQAVLKQEALRAGERLESCRQEKARGEKALKDNEQEEKELLAGAAASLQRLQEIEAQQKIWQESYDESQEQHESLYKQRMDSLEESQKLEQDAHKANRVRQQIQEEIHKLELVGAKLEMALGEWKENLFSEYGLTPERAAEEALDMEPALLKSRLHELNEKIKALGPVNPNALEEHEELSKRHGFMEKQSNDLVEAKENLEKILAEMDEAMSKQFTEAFAQIQVYFREIFVRLFGGGEAELKLTDNEDVLNAGVEILVTLPQKKRQNLSALSGGERALTVIALLFSFLRYRPSPFSVLDEIDAPLDEANVVRFGTFLREFAEETQFIVVTHRKGTMEAVDTMYGVTIEDAGVSRILSVKLDELVD